jgi:hypothetical protein
MEISDIVYLAFATIMVIVVLHIGVFWISRTIQAPKPKIVYVDRTPLPALIPELQVPPAPPQPQPQIVVLPPRVEPPQSHSQTVTVPTFIGMPPPAAQPMLELPPPIDTREMDKVGWSGSSGGTPAK